MKPPSRSNLLRPRALVNTTGRTTPEVPAERASSRWTHTAETALCSNPPASSFWTPLIWASTDASAEGRHATGRRVVKSPTTLSMSGWTSGRSKMVRFSVTPPPPLQADSTLA